MRLSTKFNLLLFLVFAAGLATAGTISYSVLHEHAREEVRTQAELLMEAAMAIRGYTVEKVKPLLAEQMKKEFLRPSVPSWAATQNLETIRRSAGKRYKDYTYKEAALNPTNLVDRATDWEADLIEAFRNDEGAREIHGERDTPLGRSLYYARPIRISDAGCLVCHSTPDKAPATMRKVYGDRNGFGWRLGEVVGAQVVSVPLSVPLQKARQEFAVFMGSLLGIFVVLFVLVNLLLRRVVVRRVRRLAHLADQASTGGRDVPEVDIPGRDEIADLGRSFNRMSRSLGKAMDMLEE
jgi:protein-histidine pros-kinase